MARLPKSFYLRPDVVRISRDLLGKYLLTRIGGKQITGGMIVETEAYAGSQDRASHAFGNRLTRRTEVMFREGGIAYVYLCYGMHALLNVVTNAEGIPDAILIRAIKPAVGIKTMLKRRGKMVMDHRLASGPGTLTRALGIDCSHNGESLTGRVIWLEDRGCKVGPAQIVAGPRVGVDYAGPDAKRPWRFSLKTGWEERTPNRSPQ